MGARRGRRDDHRGQAEQFIGLKDHTVTVPGLLVSSGSSGRSQSKDLTSLHEEFPSNGPRELSPYDPRGQRLGASPQRQGHRAARAAQARR